jgi:hypothetical protein
MRFFGHSDTAVSYAARATSKLPAVATSFSPVGFDLHDPEILIHVPNRTKREHRVKPV